MEYVILNNGVQMPILGFGVFMMNHDECVASIVQALKVGYRLIDTAASYENETAVGEAIKLSGIDRSKLFITSKLWILDTGYEATKKAFARSLERMQLDYIDLYLIHQPFGDVYGSYRAMEELYREGKIKAMGVSNFTPDRLVDLILHNDIVPMVNQVETHPFNQQVESHEWMIRYGVQHEAWGPFAEGKNNLFMNPVLETIAKKHHKSVAQICLRYLIERGVVAIPKTTHIERMVENFTIFDFELTSEDVTLIEGLDQKASLFFSHSDPEVVERLSQLKRNT